MRNKVDNKINMVITIVWIKCKTILNQMDLIVKMDQDSFLHSLVSKKIYIHRRGNNSQITNSSIQIHYYRIAKCQDKANNQTY